MKPQTLTIYTSDLLQVLRDIVRQRNNIAGTSFVSDAELDSYLVQAMVFIDDKIKTKLGLK
jgi:hypothetical protein